MTDQAARQRARDRAAEAAAPDDGWRPTPQQRARKAAAQLARKERARAGQA
jgi:hypothetical protein